MRIEIINAEGNYLLRKVVPQPVWFEGSQSIKITAKLLLSNTQSPPARADYPHLLCKCLNIIDEPEI